MSEHKADLIGGDTIDTAPGTTGASSKAVPESMKIESPKLAPDMDSNAEAAKVEATKAEASKAEAHKVETPKADTPRPTGKIMIMAPARDEAWTDERAGHNDSMSDDSHTGMPGKRRISAMAAVIALAAVAGVLGGALATTAIGHLTADDSSKTASIQARALEESIMRLDVDIAALKKQNVAQVSKFNDRFDKVERAQAEPAAKLAKLSETVEKLKVTSAPAPQPVAAVPAKDVTGSIQAPVPTPAPKPEIARLPTVEGWVLREVVGSGGAMIEGRQGIYEVYAGDPVPGLGRIDAIRKQDGRWVVVTSKGLIVAR